MARSLRPLVSLASLAGALAVLTAARPAGAIVNQVDGTIVPQSPRLQACLDKPATASATNPAPGEGRGLLDALRDASIYPQTFTPAPRMSDGRRIVTLTDVGEGSGFRNRFGWYNVGDSPYSPATRHEIYNCRDRNVGVGCACPCNDGPRGAAPSPAPACTRWLNGNIVEVDFDCLQRAGTWRGGPIAFYILTAETLRPCSTASECAAYGAGAYCSMSVGRCVVGGGCPAATATDTRVYSTDNAINDDGDHVHFLIYTSRAFADAFYFGWEDLFRGGDNDFEDVLIRAVGLVPFCNPSPEICDGRDNDCNGLVDDGVGDGGPCGEAVGECRAGTLVCEGGRYVCRGMGRPSPEVCDGLDNDCDGTVDDGDPGGGASCDRSSDGAPLCMPGTLRCRGGALVCEGGTTGTVEVCDCEDNDCDGQVDEPPADGALCPGGAACIACACRTPCERGEFPCSAGLICRDGFCMPPLCGSTTCADHETCSEGRCVDACSLVTCPEGRVCRAAAGIGRCVEDNCYGLGCPDPGQICLESTCVPDPCRGLACGSAEFCRAGRCVPSCADVRCRANETCVDGQCRPDPCASVTCAPGMVCNERGACEADRCANVGCSGPRVCRDGACVDDPCAHITCPGAPDVVCRRGQCVRADYQPLADRELVVGAGGTCAAVPGRPGGRGGVLALAGVVLAALALARRRLGRAAAAAGLVATAAAAAGCQPDPYCLNCVDGGGARDVVSRDRVFVEAGCTPTGEEVCDGRDNDCDGEVDEGFDTQTDPRNCGACGTTCEVPHALPACLSGRCGVRRCDVGYYDLDGNPTNGCEYMCNPTAATELCDGRDNDCNGLVDEGIDTSRDVNHCGACRNECRFTRAMARCEAGRCVMGGCEAGFVDLDRDPANGCEYACRATGSEVCDGRDNDCDGMTDEGCLRLFPASDVRLDRGGANSVRPAIAGDGAGALGVVYMDLRNGEADIFFARSADDGASWQPDVRLDADAAGARDSVGPALAWSGPRVTAVWSDFRTSNHYREVRSNASTTSGAAFAPVDVRANSGTGDAFNVRVVARRNTVVAVWEELLVDRSRQVRFARTTTGAVWSSGRIDHAPAGTIASSPAVAIGRDNDVYVVWHDNRNGLNDVFYNRSTDGGATWRASDTRLDTDAPGAHDSASPSVAADEAGHVYVAWQDVRTGRAFDIYARASRDGGATFEPSDRRLDTTMFDSDSLAPTALALPGNRAAVVWQDYRTGRANIFASTSADGGATWSAADVPVMGNRGHSTALEIAAAAAGGTVFVAWSDDRNGRTDIYANYSNDGGNTFQPDDVRLDTGSTPGAADSQSPAIFAAGGAAHVAWVDRRGDGVLGDVYYRSLRP